jgi:hypothetical protein
MLLSICLEHKLLPYYERYELLQQFVIHKSLARKRLKISYDNNKRLLTITDVYAVIHVSVYISVLNHLRKDDIWTK